MSTPVVPAPTSSVAPETWVTPTWEQVVREHSARVYRLAYRLSGNAHDAEDLTQETFIRVFRALASFTPGTFEGWLHRITACRAARRARSRSTPTRSSTRRSRRRSTPCPRTSAWRWCSATSRG